MFDGSDPSIRSKFELYLFSLLYSIKLYTTSPSASSIDNQNTDDNDETYNPNHLQPITQEFVSKLESKEKKK